MQTGLLWFDNNPSRELAAKVQDAAGRYREKFGAVPTTCYVNEGALGVQDRVVSLPNAPGKALRLIPASNILPNHFWIGVEEAS